MAIEELKVCLCYVRLFIEIDKTINYNDNCSCGILIFSLLVLGKVKENRVLQRQVLENRVS